jgi:long-chain fatty acid transport protein
MLKLRFFVIFLLISSVCFAGNVDTFGIGSKATAMGGAFSAYADDVYATHYNPAGLTQINSLTISVGAEYMDPELKVHDYTATDYNGGNVASNVGFNDDSDNLLVPHFGIAMPIGNFVLGLTAYVPYGLHIKWDDDPEKNPAVYVAAESYYIREVVAPTLAYKINDKWSIGGAILIGKTYAAEKRRVYAPGLPNHNKLVTVEMEDSFNWSFNLGVQYKPIEQVTIGLTYRSKADVELEGDAEVDDWSGVGGDVDVDGVEIDHPEQIQFGVRYVPINNFSMEIDVVYSKWSQVSSYTAYFDPALMGSKEEAHYKRK